MLIEEMKVSHLMEIMKALNNFKPTNEVLEDNRYVIVRTYSAGVFAGNIESKNGKEIVLRNARRLWPWSGAASLSQLAEEGVSKPEGCKFPIEIDKIILLEAIEIINVTKKAQQSISSVPIWSE
jgi:hypothetical protein